MPTFAYKAKSGPDKVITGEIEAVSQAAAATRLEAVGHVPMWVKEVAPVRTAGRLAVAKGRASARDVTVFTRQLAGLLRAGVPILRALDTIQRQSESPAFQSVMTDMASAVRDGKTLSEALRRYPALFPDLYINMVRSGESSGMLEEILLRLAEAREGDDELQSRIVAALAYPSLVLTMGALSVFVILAFFLPRIVHLFEGMGGLTLPWPTRIVLGTSAFFARYWAWLAALAVAAGFAARRTLATERGRLFVDGAVLHLPLVGRFARDTDIVRFARTLALLVRAGIPVERSLNLGANTLANRQLRSAVLTVAGETVRQGATIASGFGRQGDIPAFVTNMVAVGEESGRLDEALNEVAAFYQRELERDLRLLSTLLEPLLILAVGAMVGFIIFAMLLPVFQIGQSIR
jgi:general secretion pathway protein F